jgi:hypothetical protein
MAWLENPLPYHQIAAPCSLCCEVAMWICLNDSFLSIVSDRNTPNLLLVRSRRSGDIEAVFPDAKVIENLGTDYKYRASIDRKKVAAAIADRAMHIDYSNFKNSVDDQERHDAYLNIWLTIYRFQC